MSHVTARILYNINRLPLLLPDRSIAGKVYRYVNRKVIGTYVGIIVLYTQIHNAHIIIYSMLDRNTFI